MNKFKTENTMQLVALFCDKSLKGKGFLKLDAVWRTQMGYWSLI